MSKPDEAQEAEANEFAMELLMPSAWLLEDIAGMDVDDDKLLSELSKKYRVSNAVIAFRIGQLRERGANHD